MAHPNDYRAICYNVRQIPGQHGLRETTVEIRQGVWTGDYTGRGTEDAWGDAITEAGGYAPRVRELNGEQLALNELGAGSITVGPITPPFTSGSTTLGTDLSLFIQGLENGRTLHLRLTGPKYPGGALFRVSKIAMDRALHYTITAEPVASGA